MSERSELHGDQPSGSLDKAEFFAAIVDGSSDAIIGQTLEGEVTYWNAGAERLYGHSAQDMIGAPIFRIVPTERQPEFRFLLSRVRKGERVQELDTRRVTKAGRIRDVSIMVSPVSDATGAVIGISTIERDITQRRRTDAIVEGQRSMLEALTRTGRLQDGVRSLLDAVAGLTAENVVPAVMQLDDESRLLRLVASHLPSELEEELTDGVPIAPHGHPSGEAAFSRQAVSIPNIDESGNWNGLRDHIRSAGYQSVCSLPIQAPSGETLGTLDLYGTMAGDPRREDLEVASALGSTAALAIDRIKTVQELRLGREVISSLYEINTLLAAEPDSGRIIQRATDEAVRLTNAEMGGFFHLQGHTHSPRFEVGAVSGPVRAHFETLAEDPVSSLLRQSITSRVVQRFDDVTRDPRFRHSRKDLAGLDGAAPVRSFMSAPVRTRNGDTIGLILFGHRESGQFTRWHEQIARGVSQQTALAVEGARMVRQADQRAAELSNANERKAEFLALLGHELRNPLSAINSSLLLLGEAECSDRVRERSMGILERQTQQMSRLVDDLLDVSRIDRGKIELKRSYVDMNHVVRAAASSVQAVCDERGQKISVETPEESLVVHGDPARLEQIVGNLLHNARKFSPRDTKIQATLSRDGDHMELRVEDEGRGLTATDLTKIFEMFEQADRTEQPSTGGGLGLGLTLVRELCRMHDGTVRAHSDGLGKGSHFDVRLPLVEVPADASTAPGATETNGSADTRESKRILVVEDQRDAADAIKMLLEAWGHEVHLARRGEEALDLFHRQELDAALLDIGLPDTTGWDLAEKLRSSPRGGALRLAALTGLGQESDQARSRESGFDVHFTKPIKPGELKGWLAK